MWPVSSIPMTRSIGCGRWASRSRRCAVPREALAEIGPEVGSDDPRPSTPASRSGRMSSAPINRFAGKKHYCDEQTMPEWGVGPDGRPVKLDGDARLPGLYAEWDADACQHPHTIVVLEPDSLGRPQYFERCDHCGLKLSSAIGHAAARKLGVSDVTREQVEELARRYVAERRRAFDAMARAAAERCQPANRQSYDDYLRSDAWK